MTFGANPRAGGWRVETGRPGLHEGQTEGEPGRLRLASIDKINPNNILGGTDCGFETFANFGNVSYVVGLQKLEALAEGAALASEDLGLS